MIQMLVDFGADVDVADKHDVGGATPLHYAVQMNNYEVRAREDNGSDGWSQANGVTAAAPVVCGCVGWVGAQAVELLLANGANPNVADHQHGWTPLHVAVRLQNNNIAKLLVAKGAPQLRWAATLSRFDAHCACCVRVSVRVRVRVHVRVRFWTTRCRRKRQRQAREQSILLGE